MPAGQSYGPNRVYQEQCRDMLKHLLHEQGVILQSYRGEGIDIPFNMGGTTWSLDIVLQNPAGELFVGECKRWAGPVEQGNIATFAYELHLLRELTDQPVRGFFFAKASYRDGARKAADGAGISTYTLPQGQSFLDFIVIREITVRGVRRGRARLQQAMVAFRSNLGQKGNLSLQVKRADGTTEEL